eukprot:819747-Amphidinium_carterae.1
MLMLPVKAQLVLEHNIAKSEVETKYAFASGSLYALDVNLSGKDALKFAEGKKSRRKHRPTSSVSLATNTTLQRACLCSYSGLHSTPPNHLERSTNAKLNKQQSTKSGLQTDMNQPK